VGKGKPAHRENTHFLSPLASENGVFECFLGREYPGGNRGAGETPVARLVGHGKIPPFAPFVGDVDVIRFFARSGSAPEIEFAQGRASFYEDRKLNILLEPAILIQVCQARRLFSCKGNDGCTPPANYPFLEYYFKLEKSW
jgi:hypothetical protein